jgi:hypothetical protein
VKAEALCGRFGCYFLPRGPLLSAGMPAQAGIQESPAAGQDDAHLRLLDHPPSRVMTAGGMMTAGGVMTAGGDDGRG